MELSLLPARYCSVLIPNIYGALYYGVVNAVASPFYNVPFTIITMNALSDYSKPKIWQEELLPKKLTFLYPDVWDCCL